MDLYIREIKAEPTAPGVKEILVPGEIEYLRMLEQTEQGIELPENLFTELDEIGKRYQLDLRSFALQTV